MAILLDIRSLHQSIKWVLLRYLQATVLQPHFGKVTTVTHVAKMSGMFGTLDVNKEPTLLGGQLVLSTWLPSFWEGVGNVPAGLPNGRQSDPGLA